MPVIQILIFHLIQMNRPGDILTAIENQSEYVLIYNRKIIPLSQHITLPGKKIPLMILIKYLNQNSPLEITISENYLLIKMKNTTKKPRPFQGSSPTQLERFPWPARLFILRDRTMGPYRMKKGSVLFRHLLVFMFRL